MPDVDVRMFIGCSLELLFARALLFCGNFRIHRFYPVKIGISVLGWSHRQRQPPSSTLSPYYCVAAGACGCNNAIAFDRSYTRCYRLGSMTLMTRVETRDGQQTEDCDVSRARHKDLAVGDNRHDIFVTRAKMVSPAGRLIAVVQLSSEVGRRVGV